MIIIAYEVDEQGFIVECHPVNKDDENHNYITVTLPDGLFTPLWSGSEWIEGKTEEEFLEDAFLASLNPSAQDLAKAERDLETIELLIEMGLI